ELWPRLLNRELPSAAVRLLKDANEDDEENSGQTLRSVRNLLEVHERLGWERLPLAFARRLVAAPKRQSFAAWPRALPSLPSDPTRGKWRAADLPPRPAPPAPQAKPPRPLTFGRTARRSFEVAYWKAIAWLSAGPFANKNNADPCLDPPTVES